MVSRHSSDEPATNNTQRTMSQSNGSNTYHVNHRLFPEPPPTGPLAALNAEQIQDLRGIVNNIITLRRDLYRQLMDPRRDVEVECGYPRWTDQIQQEMYQQLYERNAIAARVVEVFPKECWQVQPSVYEDEDSETVTPFEEAWDRLGKTLRGQFSWFKEEEGSPQWEYLRRIDILSGIGSFGVLLLGLDDGLPLDQPAKGWKEENSQGAQGLPLDRKDGTQEWTPPGPKDLGQEKGEQREAPPQPERKPDYEPPAKQKKPYNTRNRARHNRTPDGIYRLTINAEQTKGRKLLYLRAFPEYLVQVTQYESNFSSPRCGQPIMYAITMNDPRMSQGGIGLPLATKNVHWSRVIHIADNRGSNEAFGMPRMRPVLDNLLGLRKITSGDPEGYWKNAFPTISLETHPQLGGDVNVDHASIRDQLEQNFNGLQRYLSLMGMSAKVVAPTVTDPTPHKDMQLEMICILLGIPVRVFKGSERGELASSQDDAAWNDRVRERQRNYLTPMVIVPFVDRLIHLGVLPEPKAQPKPKPQPGMAAAGKPQLGPDGKPVAPKLGEDGKPLPPGVKAGAAVPGQPPTKDGPPKPGVQPGAGRFGKPPATPQEEGEEDDEALLRNAYGDDEEPDVEGEVPTGKPEPSSVDQAEGAMTKLATPGTKPTAPGEQPGKAGAPLMGGGEGQPQKQPTGYCVYWPDMTSQTQTEKATVAAQKVTAIAAYAQGMEAMMTPLDFWTKIMGFDEEEARSIVGNAEEHAVQMEADQLAQQQQAIEAGIVPDPLDPHDPVKLKEGEMLAPNPNNPGVAQKPVANPKAMPGQSGQGPSGAGGAGGPPPFGGKPGGGGGAFGGPKKPKPFGA